MLGSEPSRADLVVNRRYNLDKELRDQEFNP